MKRYVLLLALILAGVASSACPKAPPNLSPDAQLAYVQHEVIRVLDLVEAVAIDANKQTPPLVSDATTKAIVLWHQSAYGIVSAAGTGWRNVVKASFDALVNGLPAADRQRLAPYIPVIDGLLEQTS